jgi:hypothetical protein
VAKTKKINEGFTCAKCERAVPPHAGGSCRNHCPFCLHSLHVDEKVPGDRLSDCQGVMAPIGFEQGRRKGPRLEHMCVTCGFKAFNPAAPDDDWELICQLSRIPR